MNTEKKKVAFNSVLAAIFLTVSKLLIGIFTNSLGILSEALHSFFDLIATVITFFTVRISDLPADEDHHYGHGKVENLSALMETILLFITCFWIGYEAIFRIISGEGLHLTTSQTIWSLIIVCSSIIIDFWRSRKLKIVADKYNSQALEADALHFSTDIWSSTVVLLGIICVKIYEWTKIPLFYYADSVAALLVAIIVLYVSYKLAKKSIDVLLDKSPTNIKQIIENILDNQPKILKYHSIKARTSGADTFIKFNIHLEPEMDLMSVHKICDEIENQLKQKFERSEIFIHAEPHIKEHILAEIETNS